MAEKPILFSGEMVRAILDGRKSQTRRIIKPQPYMGEHAIIGGAVRPCLKWQRTSKHPTWMAWERQGWQFDPMIDEDCPYGRRGDCLWVKETFALWDAFTTEYEGDLHIGKLPKPEHPEEIRQWKRNIQYRADGEGSDMTWRSSRFMPRWASRILLRVERVKAERVQDITLADAIVEGCHDDVLNGLSPLDWFEETWNSINAKRGYGWDVNPWVWVIDFSVQEPTPMT